jgi:drug/metabolite transporter (DMT)-like permease
VIAVLGGLGAAVCWATGTLSAARASRLVGARSVLVWVMLVGFAITAPVAAASGVPQGLGRHELGWIALSGIGNVGGLLLAYEGMRVGKVSIVAPISSTEGAIAAVLAVATGEALGGASAALLAAIVVGVVLASLAPSTGDAGAQTTRSTLCAAGAAVAFGGSLFATAKVSNALPLVWAVIPPRAVGVLVVALPSLAARRIRIARAAIPFVALSGLCEVLGFASYALGARHGVAVSAVLASQFAGLAAAAAFVLFRERLRPVQLAGIGTIVVCVAALSAIRA